MNQENLYMTKLSALTYKTNEKQNQFDGKGLVDKKGAIVRENILAN